MHDLLANSNQDQVTTSLMFWERNWSQGKRYPKRQLVKITNGIFDGFRSTIYKKKKMVTVKRNNFLSYFLKTTSY